MAGGSSNTELIFQLRAHSKELRKELEQLKKFNVQQKRESRVSAREEQKRDRQRSKSFGDHFKSQERARKADREHLRWMSREESKRHKVAIGFISKQQKEQNKLRRENERLSRGGGGGRGGRGAFFGGLSGAAIGSVVARAGMGLWNFFVGGVMAGYENYKNFNAARFKAAGLSNKGTDIRRASRGGARFGFNMIDTAGMIPAMARSTGQLSPVEMMRSMRATGMEAGEVGGVFNTIRRAGYGFGDGSSKKDSAGQRVFRDMIAGGLYSGLERARLPEYFKGVQQMSEEQQNLTTGVVNIADIIKQLAIMGASGKPGLQGAAGANVLNKLTNSLTNPGGGDFGEGLVLRAMGFGKPSGAGGVSYFQAMMRREEGIQGPEGAKNIQRLMNQAQAEGGTKEETGFMLKQLTGMSLHQAMDVQDIFGGGGTMQDKLKAVSQKMESAKPMDEQAADAMKSIDGNVKHIVELTDKGIGLGGKYADKIEEFDNLQIKLLTKISEGIDALVDYFKGNGRGSAEKVLSDIDRKKFKSNTPGGALSELQDRVAAAQAAKNAALEPPTALELATGSKTVAKGQELAAKADDAVKKAMRQQHAVEMLRMQRGDSFDPNDSGVLKYINAFGNATGYDPTDPNSQVPDITMPAPSMTRHKIGGKKKKGTDSGVVQAPTVKPTSGTFAPVSADDILHPIIRVDIKPHFDARNLPPAPTVQKPGTSGKSSRR